MEQNERLNGAKVNFVKDIYPYLPFVVRLHWSIKVSRPHCRFINLQNPHVPKYSTQRISKTFVNTTARHTCCWNFFRHMMSADLLELLLFDRKESDKPCQGNIPSQQTGHSTRELCTSQQYFIINQ
jgi:hypothetical protein